MGANAHTKPPPEWKASTRARDTWTPEPAHPVAARIARSIAFQLGHDPALMQRLADWLTGEIAARNKQVGQ